MLFLDVSFIKIDLIICYSFQLNFGYESENCIGIINEISSVASE